MDLFAGLDMVEGRLGNIEMTVLNQEGYVAIEESQEQGADMCAVNVSVAHDYDTAVAQFRDVEILIDSGPDCSDDVFYFVVFENFIKSYTLDVQNFTA